MHWIFHIELLIMFAWFLFDVFDCSTEQFSPRSIAIEKSHINLETLPFTKSLWSNQANHSQQRQQQLPSWNIGTCLQAAFGNTDFSKVHQTWVWCGLKPLSWHEHEVTNLGRTCTLPLGFEKVLISWHWFKSVFALGPNLFPVLKTSLEILTQHNNIFCFVWNIPSHNCKNNMAISLL